MAQAPTLKGNTAHIMMSEPDEEQLKKSLQGRELSPGLATFLKNLVRTKKWTRKITLPSAHDDLAVALVFTSTLKETGLEIVSELHIFLSGKIIIEEWQVVGENQKTSAIPKESFTSITIQKVTLRDDTVFVDLLVPMSGGAEKTITKAFDFGTDEPKLRQVAHPVLGI